MSMLTGLKLSSLAYKCINFTDQNIIQKEGWTKRVDGKKWGHFSSCHVYSPCYSH